MFLSILLTAAALSSPIQTAPQDTSPEAAAQLKQGIGAVLRADTAEARIILSQIPAQQLDEEDR